ncbi:GNAT family N-acetyltransferase [Streptomyces zagrosensis]|uniref:GNAT superfamily N-acetyltransferase n=1 Tax=Streptomyces zagrosensis TaxID=1042984 RepID=A0A7W9UZR1_9ACTN|nr:GNAT family N-acetyltransferase [Streptomyces zagrosensis]MBB5937022.1 GNAT superfamily N-acetyltransferase [Streptomyces zagrosensis]
MDPLDAASPGHSNDQRPAAPSAPPTGEAAGLTVGGASLEDWHQVAEWAAAEGWNPGRRDVACFHPTDPAGFFVGRLDGRLVSAVSLVGYSDQYAFLGYYLVHPEFRRQGLGVATWQAAMPHAGSRLIGLDAVPAQQATYERSGFTSAYETIRYAGVPERPHSVATGAVAVTREHIGAIADYDRHCFPAERRAFVDRWLTAEGHRSYAWVQDGQIAGYGVIRPARDGQRLGPLFADSQQGAEALLDALLSHLGPGENVYLDMPEPNAQAGALAAARGLKPDSVTTRMYTGPAPQTRTDSTYAVTSLELG